MIFLGAFQKSKSKNIELIFVFSIVSATLDGAIGALIPLTEKIFRRLAMLQNSLSTMFPQHCGLNPKSFR